MNTWFTSDTHFGHRAVIKYSKRPFAHIDEMNEALIDNWNAVVNHGDIVYHLGDVSFHGPSYTQVLLGRLKGRIHLIRGNHDHLNKATEACFETVDDVREIYVGQQKIVLCHYAMLVWNKSHYGVWMLHGHSHGNLRIDNTARRMDVGVDAVPGYRPIEYAEVKEIMDKRRFVSVDHHVEGGE